MRPERSFHRLLAQSWIAGVVFVSAVGSARAGDWYVDVNAATGGDGSAAHPFQAIKTALNNSSDGDRILVSAGTYVEYLTAQKSVSILGDAGATTTISPLPTTRTALTISPGKNVWLQDLTLTGTSTYDGGGINNAGAIIAVRCHVTGCKAMGGGGIYNTGTLVMWGCVVDNCSTDYSGSGNGGGIWNRGTLKLFDCTVSGNKAGDYDYASGGGILSSSAPVRPDTSVLRLVNVTVCDNKASAGSFMTPGFAAGGGICANGKVSIDHSTIAGNDAHNYGSYVLGEADGGGFYGTEAADVTHSIFANNTSYVGPDFYGTCNSLGYLLIRNPTYTTIQGDMTGVQLIVDPLLNPLADNGGLVPTEALDPASPCIDTGNPDPFASPTHDARDFPRALWDPSVGASDLGAYEYGATPSFLLTATPDLPLPPGVTLALTTGGGTGGHAFTLALVDVNGTPGFVPIVVSTFNAMGVYELSGVVPSGLSGSTVKLQTFALDANGRLASTNVATLVFQ